MKAESTKLELIQWLANINDKSLLGAIAQFKKTFELSDWADSMTPEQINSINKGMEEIKKGKTIPSSKVWAKYGRKSNH